MRRVVLPILLAILTLFTVLNALAKPKWGESAGKQQTGTAGTDFLAVTFGVDRTLVIQFARYGLTTEELALVFYLHAVAGRPVSEAEIRYVLGKRDWGRLAWYLGLPPVVLEDGIFVLRRPWHARIQPPLGMGEYKNERKGEYEEKIEIRPDKYEYKYEHKRLGIEEKLEITRDKYEYGYKDRSCEEKLTVDLRTYRYEYKYENKRTKAEIKKHGTGQPITPALVYQYFQGERLRDPGFSFSIKLEIKL